MKNDGNITCTSLILEFRWIHVRYTKIGRTGVQWNLFHISVYKKESLGCEDPSLEQYRMPCAHVCRLRNVWQSDGCEYRPARARTFKNSPAKSFQLPTEMELCFLDPLSPSNILNLFRQRFARFTPSSKANKMASELCVAYEIVRWT